MRSRAEYQRIYDAGRRYGSRSFLLFVWARTPQGVEAEGGAGCMEDGPAHRLGTAVSRKIGSAVVRNRCKRLLREWFRQERPRWGWPQGCDAAFGAALSQGQAFAGMDIVVVPRRGVNVKAMSLQGVASELSPAVRRAWKDCLKQARAAVAQAETAAGASGPQVPGAHGGPDS